MYLYFFQIFGSPFAGAACNAHPMVVQFTSQNKQNVQRFIEEWVKKKKKNACKSSQSDFKSAVNAPSTSKWPAPAASRTWPDAASFFKVHDVLYSNRANLRNFTPKSAVVSVPVSVSVSDLLL